jgi:hypothetical protein
MLILVLIRKRGKELVNVKREGNIMITKEQAAEMLMKERAGQSEYYSSEIRIISIEEVMLPEPYRFHDETITWKRESWRCTYEHRDKIHDRHWSEWKVRECFVVEPEEGPHVIGPFD